MITMMAMLTGELAAVLTTLARVAFDPTNFPIILPFP